MRKTHLAMVAMLCVTSSFLGGAAAVMLLNAPVASAQSRPPSQPEFDAVKVHSLEVVDYEGNTRLVLDGGGENGKGSFALVADGGLQVAHMETYKDGQEQYATLTLLEGGTRSIIKLDPSTKKGASITMDVLRGRGRIWSAP